MRRKNYRNGGFTLLELVVTVAILGILTTIAIPAFVEMMANVRLKGYANSMMSTLFLARSEAIKRNSRVVLCKSSNGTSCTGNWKDGWIVFADANNNSTVDGGEQIIHRINALATGYAIIVGGNAANYVSYASDGIAKTTGNFPQNDSFNICPPSAAGKTGRKIVISPTGRPRIEIITTCN